MKKNIILLFLIILVSIVIIGCKKEEKIDNDTIKEADLLLYSDKEKKVYEDGNTRYVFYYKDDKITGYQTYIDYDTNALAKKAFKDLDRSKYINASKYYVKGKYIVFEWKKSEYEDLTVNIVKTKYSKMKELIR